MEYDENGIAKFRSWEDLHQQRWRSWYRNPTSNGKDMVYKLVGFKRLTITLWYNGARWVAWVPNLFVCEPTDFKDPRKPPFEWAEGMNTLVNK